MIRPPAELPETAPGGVLPLSFGRFEVVREIGRGGFGVVYLARDPVLGRDVALKLPRPEMAGHRGSAATVHARGARHGGPRSSEHRPRLRGRRAGIGRLHRLGLLRRPIALGVAQGAARAGARAGRRPVDRHAGPRGPACARPRDPPSRPEAEQRDAPGFRRHRMRRRRRRRFVRTDPAHHRLRPGEADRG